MTYTHLHIVEPWVETLATSSISPDVDGVALSRTLESDLATLSEDIGFIFEDGYVAELRTDLTVQVLKKWQVEGQEPSLPALCLFALQRLGDIHEDYLPVLVASVLGEVPNDLPYHGNIHYKKVVLQLIRLMVAHNKIFESTPRALSGDQIALLLIAACVHDLSHDGRSNTVKGVYEQSRMEKESFGRAKDSLGMAGLSVDDLDRILLMLLCTDVSPINDPANPARQMKAAYAHHFLPDLKKTDTLHLSPELVALEEDKALVQMCLLLHEADIATSAGLDYEVTKYETALYRKELGKHDACPQHVLDFLEKTCQRKFLSDAGTRLYSANIARIHALVEEDLKRGNLAYPAPEDAAFLSAQNIEQGASSRTIN